MRGGDAKERRGSGGGATRDLRDHAVRCLTVESSDDEGWRDANAVVGVFGGVRVARASNLREM